MAAKGHRPPNAGKGRKKGVPNKITASTRAALNEAFEQLGGVPSLVSWGKREPTEFYRIWARLVPHEVHGAGGGPLLIRVIRDDIPTL